MQGLLGRKDTGEHPVLPTSSLGQALPSCGSLAGHLVLSKARFR